MSSACVERKLQYTSIIKTLAQLRNDYITAMIDAANAKEENIDFDIDDPSRKRETIAKHGEEHLTLAIISKGHQNRCAGRRRHPFPQDKCPL